VLGVRTLGYDAALDHDPLYRTDGPLPRQPATTDLTPLMADLPRDGALAQGLRAGHLDAWNPLAGGGAPLWALGNPFFPLKVPFYLWPSRRMYDVVLLCRLLVAATGAYVLGRLRGLSRAGAFVAGGTFELSGALLAQLPYATSCATPVLPWALAAAIFLARRPGRLSIAASGLVLGGAALGGHAPTDALVFLAFATALLGHAIALGWPRGARVIAAGAIVGALALGIAAPAVLPLLELMREGFSYKQDPMGPFVYALELGIARNTLPIALFVPGIFAGLPLVDAHAIAPAVGPLVLGLGVAGALAGGLDLPLALVALVGVALATAPGVSAAGRLPFFHLLLPVYAWPPVVLAVTQAAGRGVDAGLTRRGPTLAGLAVLVIGPATLALVHDANGAFAPRYATALRAALGDWRQVLVLAAPLLVAIATLAMLGLGRRPRGSTLRAASVLGVATLTQAAVLFPLVWQPRSTALTAPPSPAVEFLSVNLADGRSRMTGLGGVGRPMSTMLFGLRDLRAAAAIAIRRYVEFLDAIAPPGRLGHFTVFQPGSPTSPLLDLAAVRWVVQPRATLALPPADLPVAYRDEYVVIYQRPTALPRARVVHRMQPVADEAAARAALVARRTAPLDPSFVTVEPDEDGRYPAPLADGDASEPVRIVPTDTPDRVVLEATLARDGLVVLADTYYPGWRAELDGRPAAIHAADLLFRAVRVPAGTHRIEFIYAPRSVRLGTALGAIATLAALALYLRRTRA
jgi:hypothetical protein